MKKILRIYLYSALMILIPFTLASLILALLSYFIQWNGFIFHAIIEAISYLILIIAGLFLTSHLKEKRMHHCLLFAFLYFILSLLMHLGNLHIIHLICKPLIFIIIGLIKEKMKS